MPKYINIIAQWTVSPFKNDITVYQPDGDKQEYDSGKGESDFLNVLNYLGGQGFKITEIATIDMGRGNFTHRAFLMCEAPEK
ncbi:MAG: hypothetical protein AB9897_05945 [Anaerolineaceae bacterium]